MSQAIIGVDLGGSRIRVARLDQELNILERQETATLAEEGPDKVIGRISDLIRTVWPKDGTPVMGIGVSSPGPLNPFTGVVLAPPNLPGWHSIPLAQILKDTFGVPTYVGNDANVAVLAEVARGAAKGCKHAIYITLSTGIGGGVLIDGRLLLGKEGFGAEIGHTILVVDGRPSSLEKEAAGPAIARQTRVRIARGEQSIIKQMVGGELAQIDSRIVSEAAQQGDELALSIVKRVGWVIGLGMVSLLHLFNPEIIVFGGSVSNMGELLFTHIRQTIRENVLDEGYLNGLRIEMAALGDNVSVVGGAALVTTMGGFNRLLE
jgi:glucokinase